MQLSMKNGPEMRKESIQEGTEKSRKSVHTIGKDIRKINETRATRKADIAAYYRVWRRNDGRCQNRTPKSARYIPRPFRAQFHVVAMSLKCHTLANLTRAPPKWHVHSVLQKIGPNACAMRFDWPGTHGARGQKVGWLNLCNCRRKMGPR